MRDQHLETPSSQGDQTSLTGIETRGLIEDIFGASLRACTRPVQASASRVGCYGRKALGPSSSEDRAADFYSVGRRFDSCLGHPSVCGTKQVTLRWCALWIGRLLVDQTS